MSARDHTEIEEALAVRALDALDEGDLTRLGSAMAAHGDCDECRELERGFAEAAALLATSLDPSPVAPEAVDRLMASATGRTAAASDELAARSARRVPVAWLAAAAAFLVLVGSLAALRAGGQRGTRTEWGARVVRFDGAEGELAMAYVPGETGVAFWGTGLPDPGPGRTYEIWMIEGETPVPGGCVTPEDGEVAIFVEADVGTADLMAVTVEPSSCPTAPTSDPILSASLS